MHRHFWFGSALLAAGAVLIALPVRAQVPPSGQFTATRTCPATRSINGPNPGQIRTAVRRSYEATGFNSTEQRYILLTIPEAVPQQRWVRATCGTFVAGGRPPEGSKPFFDILDNPVPTRDNETVDMTPPPPTLSPFDQAVLRACGPLGTEVEASQFRTLLTVQFPDVLAKLQQAVDGSLTPGRSQRNEFLEDLTRVWFKDDGFEHIFCGEFRGINGSGSDIGGLHFFGRYQEIQTSGAGERTTNVEAVPGVFYTFGVRVRVRGRNFSAPIKGYPLVSNAQELLLDGTRAYKRYENRVCTLTVTDEQTGQSYAATFVSRNDAIRTYYPDKTPDNPPCAR